MMKMTPMTRVAGKINRRGGLLLLILALLNSNPIMAQQSEAGPGSKTPSAVELSIAKTMDPNTWALMMTMAMDPRIWMNPISSCTACHDNEDVGRYQQVFGPFVSVMNPSMWTNPDIYNSMIATSMDAKAAEHWQRAVEKKYGLEPGATMPVMHAWPMVPGFPVPTPIPMPRQ